MPCITLLEVGTGLTANVTVLKGENKAALDVARRTGMPVDLSARYEQYGMSSTLR